MYTLIARQKHIRIRALDRYTETSGRRTAPDRVHSHTRSIATIANDTNLLGLGGLIHS